MYQISETDILKHQLLLLKRAITDIAKAAGIIESDVDVLSGPQCLLISYDILHVFVKHKKLIAHLVDTAEQNDVTICQDEEDHWLVINNRETVDAKPTYTLGDAIKHFHIMKEYAVPVEPKHHDLSTYDYICKPSTWNCS